MTAEEAGETSLVDKACFQLYDQRAFRQGLKDGVCNCRHHAFDKRCDGLHFRFRVLTKAPVGGCVTQCH